MRRESVDELAKADLREVLGIPASMSIEFSQEPLIKEGGVTGDQPGVQTWTIDEPPEEPE